MSADSCIVRPASSLDEAHAIFWPLINALGWTRAPLDSNTHYISTGPGGFLLVADSSKPEVAEGCIVPLVFANGTGWIGFFCLNEGIRGRGWGGKLFARALEHLSSNGAVIAGLDAVSAQVGTYERRGFVEKGMVRVLKRASVKDHPIDGLADLPVGSRLIDLEHVPTEVLVKSDLEHTGLERARLWTKEALWDRDDTFGFALCDKEKGHEELDGWVVVRSCTIGFRIGPLYANSEDVARALLKTVLKRLEDHDGGFIAELWEGNKSAEKVFTEAGFHEFVVHYHRMWLNGKVPEAQQPGGKADKEVYAIFDAGEG
ncbi:hypothetical protein BT63DRAFT_420713 [Microthyrium microscopicum]|uniref:N-acetyltransferase domain-containing protein n=1 Tax=Microthyrium microscopicum TaxID=703497 RepID=A0A6A6UTD5_9PEZI|nr:hypothetical protein BT63DRAFT_420713 [Microthyrium microscopicum]